MLKKDNKTRLLQVFFDDPIPEGIGFQLRELSRKIKLAPVSVKRYLEELNKEKLILKKEHRIHKYPIYYANRDNEYFRFLKKINTMTMVKETGLLGYLKDSCMPEVIILFGSCSRGEDIKGSDIDFYIQCKEKKLSLEKYEKMIGRHINIFFEDDFHKISKELRNNLVNGVILSGYLRLY